MLRGLSPLLRALLIYKIFVIRCSGRSTVNFAAHSENIHIAKIIIFIRAGRQRV